MRTALISDLHLGAGNDLLRDSAIRARLIEALSDVDQLVLLGDILELRELPVRQLLDLSTPLFEELGEAMAGGRVVVVPGNHDHQLGSPWLDRRHLRSRPTPLGLEQILKPPSGGPLAELARLMPKAEVALAYPGVWLRDDVYATHGHYLDCHMSVPTFEAMGVSLIERIVGGMPSDGRAPEDYEAAVAPLYALAYGLAQAPGFARRVAGTHPSVRVWRAVSGDRDRPLRRRALGSVVIPGVVWAVNRVGLGPYEPDLSLDAIGLAGIRAMAEVASRLGIDAEHVVYGHTHRRGPIADEGPWRIPGGGQLHNTGSWVYTPSFIAAEGAASPYWPGSVLMVGERGAPESHPLLESLDRAALRRALP